MLFQTKIFCQWHLYYWTHQKYLESNSTNNSVHPHKNAWSIVVEVVVQYYERERDYERKTLSQMFEGVNGSCMGIPYIPYKNILTEFPVLQQNRQMTLISWFLVNQKHTA